MTEAKEIKNQDPNFIEPEKFAGAFRYSNNPSIELMTNVAFFLWSGREKTANKSYIMSTPFFLQRLTNMESAIKQDDPWADRTYYHLQLAIDEAETAFIAKKSELEEIINDGHKRLTFPEAVIKKTINLEIKKHSRLGWRALEILLLADDTARLVLEAQHRGRIGKREKNLLIKAIESIYRSMMFHVTKWKYCGVTRDDVAANLKPAQTAKQTMGEIEDEFLEASLRSKFAPELPKRRLAVVESEDEGISDVEVADMVSKMTGGSKSVDARAE